MEVLVIIYERHNNVTGLNRSMETQTTPFDNGISNDNTDTYMSLKLTIGYILLCFAKLHQYTS
jgi:hypothetical protein